LDALLLRRLVINYLSHWRRVQLAMIHRETTKTRRTVPGQVVIRVLRTKRVLKLIWFKAPMERDDASVNNLLNGTEIDKKKEGEGERGSQQLV